MDTHNISYITDTEDFTVAVQDRKNRIYCVLGPDVTEFPEPSEIYDTWGKIESHLSGDFTLLLDAGIEKVQSPRLIEFLMTIQQAAAAKGVDKVAEVLSGSEFAYHLHEKIADFAGTGARRKVFQELRHAEEWLDSFV